MNINCKKFLHFEKKGYKKYRVDDFEMLAKQGIHLKECSLEEVVEKTRSAGLNPCLLNLCCFILFKVTMSIPQFVVPLMVKYERMVEKIIRVAKINSQHRLKYIIMSPICIAAYKSVR